MVEVADTATTRIATHRVGVVDVLTGLQADVPAAEGDEGEENSEPVDNNGIPVARPVIVESEDEDLPAQRVRLPAPRAIEFD